MSIVILFTVCVFSFPFFKLTGLHMLVTNQGGSRMGFTVGDSYHCGMGRGWVVNRYLMVQLFSTHQN